MTDCLFFLRILLHALKNIPESRKVIVSYTYIEFYYIHADCPDLDKSTYSNYGLTQSRLILDTVSIDTQFLSNQNSLYK